MTTALLTAARSVLRRLTHRDRPEHPDPWIAKGIREGWVRPGNGKPIRDDFFTLEPAQATRTVEEMIREERGE